MDQLGTKVNRFCACGMILMDNELACPRHKNKPYKIKKHEKRYSGASRFNQEELKTWDKSGHS